jgi:hypothetical protein
MREIPLTHGQSALVDDEDYDMLIGYKWYAWRCPKTKGYYAVCVTSRKFPPKRTLRMHRVIMNAKSGEQIDHANHNTLDNRKVNLRRCTMAENNTNGRKRGHNTSGFKGVYWNRDAKKWQAYIGFSKRQHYLGVFDDPLSAALAYDIAAFRFHGEFALPNVLNRDLFITSVRLSNVMDLLQGAIA